MAIDQLSVVAAVVSLLVVFDSSLSHPITIALAALTLMKSIIKPDEEAKVMLTQATALESIDRRLAGLPEISRADLAEIRRQFAESLCAEYPIDRSLTCVIHNELVTRLNQSEAKCDVNFFERFQVYLKYRI